MYREGSLFLHAGDDGGGGLGELDHSAGDVADNLEEGALGTVEGRGQSP